MSQFTPGPWSVVVTSHGYEVVAGDPREDAHVLFICVKKEDAHLIAATPEMYEALKYWLECKDLSGLDIAIAKGRSALAKAEGRS